jgi:7,8-dihydropterin-6-yl-methyl-4-(beta-D-ribofuranosyl)aminobenzene 5'-phosphate synthase
MAAVGEQGAQNNCGGVTGLALELAQADRVRVTVLLEDSVARSDVKALHGLSLWVEVTAGEHTGRFLVDVGQEPDTLWANASRLGIDLAAAHAIVLTHCHYDHTAGLAEVIRRIGRNDLPVVAHPATFRPNFVCRPHLWHVGMQAQDRPEELQRAGAILILCRDPLPLMPGVTTTGEVPRVTDFEDVGLPVWTVQDGRVLPDSMPDDISLIVNLKEQGLVVITGCSHAGIINILKHAVTMTGITRIRAVLGGFHLVGARQERIARTVAELEKLMPQQVVPGHCTGTEAQFALRQALGERWQPLATGTRLEF